MKQFNRFIVCIDLKSFYVSCECAARGWNPFEVLLAVVGQLNEPDSIVLVTSPAFKRLGTQSHYRMMD